MKIKLLENNSLNVLDEVLTDFDRNPDFNTIFLITCDNNNYSPSNLNPILTKIETPVFGGIFPAIIHNNIKYDKGSIVAGINEKMELVTLKNISNTDDEMVFQQKQYFKTPEKINTVFMFIDGFAQRINLLIEHLFLNYGLEYDYIGGGAGSLSMEQSPCIISNEGLLTDAAILAGSEISGGIGVKHGWKSIAGPFKVTGAERNIIISLDFRPAFEIYKQVIDTHSEIPITSENFFDIAKCYPFGITKLHTEKIIRDPVRVDNYKNIVCVGDINEGAFVHIMNGNSCSLISAAKDAKEISKQYDRNENQNEFMLFIDCISRVLFLEDEFVKELKAVYSPNTPLFGALTIGEIANNGKDYLEFYNKTSVVGHFSEPKML